MLFGGDISATLNGPITFMHQDNPIASGTTKLVYSITKTMLKDMLLIKVSTSNYYEYKAIYLEYLMLEQIYKQNKQSAIRVSNWSEYKNDKNKITEIRYLAEECKLNREVRETDILHHFLFVHNQMDMSDTILHQNRAREYFNAVMNVAILKIPAGIEYTRYPISKMVSAEGENGSIKFSSSEESFLIKDTTVLNIDCKPNNFCYIIDSGKLQARILDLGCNQLIIIKGFEDAGDLEKSRSSVNKYNTEFVNEEIAKCYVFLLNCLYVHKYGSGINWDSLLQILVKISPDYVKQDLFTKMLQNNLLKLMLVYYYRPRPAPTDDEEENAKQKHIFEEDIVNIETNLKVYLSPSIFDPQILPVVGDESGKLLEVGETRRDLIRERRKRSERQTMTVSPIKKEVI